MAFHLFIQPQTVLTLKNLTPALPQHTQPSNIVPSTPHRSSHVRHGVSSRTTNSTDPLLARRSADYHPNIWDYEFVESLASEYNYKNEICTGRAEKLKENVSCMFDGASGLPYSLKLIDTIQRLGLDYHFHDEIKSAIEKIYINCKDYKSDLTIEALKFRLFRQHGYEISQGVLKSFVEEANANRGGVKDFEGLLSLYEASFYAYKGEEILNEARKVTSKHLKNCLKERNDNRSRMSIFLEKVISHSLGLPLLCRVPRMEVRQHINMYEMKQDINATLLEFAKLDFNMVQATYHEDLKYVSRWDINKVNNLPHYMKICFFALYNTVNETGYENLRNNINLDVMPYLKKSVRYTCLCISTLWGNICKAFLVEATWYYSGYIPTLEEYTNNAWISVGGPLLSIHAYCQLGDHENITKEALEHMNKNQSDLIRWSSMIFRFANDLATSKNELERGDAATSVQCYMHETGVSESVAREYMQHLISASWEKINTSLPSSQRVFSSSFINTVQNVARMGQYTYQFGDGHGIPNREAKDRIMSIIVKPIRV
ncbi:hypothetical protein C5167_024804 [Papaver somniferum]|uniref:(+)-delta-cadinene synthase n=1 Tax=Papaver somniferum TaxID=3469 RepID=A0A4Y7JR86_PAPSO|nr:hypothetical protein C5167_024804 [Papaver somniferum]